MTNTADVERELLDISIRAHRLEEMIARDLPSLLTLLYPYLTDVRETTGLASILVQLSEKSTTRTL
jgi:hypothetical protein